MIDNDRLIKAWEIFRDSNPYQICNGIEFQAIKEPEYCLGKMIEDTITLLKEQDAVRPEHIMGTSVCDCGKCKHAVAPGMNYCPVCGCRIDWN